MAELLAVPLEDGGTVIVEIDEADGRPDGVVKARRPGEALTRAAQSVEAALVPVTAAARAALGELRKAGPDEVTVEFGVQFRAELGAVVARSSGECNLKVTMRWGRANDGAGDRIADRRAADQVAADGAGDGAGDDRAGDRSG